MLAYDSVDLSENRFEVLKKDVVVTEMTFDERITTGGIVLVNDNGTTKGIRPRWAKVYAIGPDQKDVVVGQWILIAHGRWTRGVDIYDGSDKITIRKVDPDDILLVSDEQPRDDTMADAKVAHS